MQGGQGKRPFIELKCNPAKYKQVNYVIYHYDQKEKEEDYEEEGKKEEEEVSLKSYYMFEGIYIKNAWGYRNGTGAIL
jgi:hypothetical protein